MNKYIEYLDETIKELQKQEKELIQTNSVGDFMSCRWSDFITGQQVASFFVIDSFR